MGLLFVLFPLTQMHFLAFRDLFHVDSEGREWEKEIKLIFSIFIHVSHQINIPLKSKNLKLLYLSFKCERYGSGFYHPANSHHIIKPESFN